MQGLYWDSKHAVLKDLDPIVKLYVTIFKQGFRTSDPVFCQRIPTRELHLEFHLKYYDVTKIKYISADQASKLRCPHKELDEALKSLLGNLTKQVGSIFIKYFPKIFSMSSFTSTYVNQ